MTAREIDPEATYTSESAEALRIVFERMPEACQRMVLVAARRPGTWIPYDVAEKEAGLRPAGRRHERRCGARA